MKPIIKFYACIFFITTVVFVACKKDKPVSSVVAYVVASPPSPPLPITDSLTGREFIFSDLIWDYDNDGAANLYVGLENRSDLFSVNRAVKVSVKSDINNIWIIAEKFHYPNAPGYVYSIYSKSLFVFPSPHIFPWSGNTQLAGTKVSLKVKFL